MRTAKQLANLKPAKKGEVRNPKGRTKGSQNMATVFRQLLEDDKLIITIAGSRGRPIKKKYPAKAIGLKLIKQALEGDVAAVNALRKTAYGDKVDMTVSNAESALADWHNDLKEQDEQLARDVAAARVNSARRRPQKQAVAPDSPVQNQG